MELQKRQELLAIEILKNCRNELYHRFPYFDGMIAALDGRVQRELEGFATDGNCLYVHPEKLLSDYLEEPAAVMRGYLHLLLHCLYLHIIPDTGLEKQRWNLACDMAVESLLWKEWRKEQEHAVIKDTDRQNTVIKNVCMQMLRQTFGKDSFSAEELYVLLRQEFFPYAEEKMEKAFRFDDHKMWWAEQSEYEREGVKQKWEKMQGTMGSRRWGTSQRAGSEPGNEEEEIGTFAKSRYDYRKFLKRFAVLREEVELDMESFDYIYYSYGLEQYKDMPLIEPLEYKEGHKLEELVIAIDTSGSCSTDMVRQFLQESYAILGERENFFHHMKVYFIQCDCVIQDVVCIHSEEEWKQYCKNLQIQGRAGTDFRPVFRYVETLREEKQLKNLKALIYFTDGDGVYPREVPEYETAFVFVKRTEGLKFVPSWAKSLVVG